jgi:hypothetical protein
MVLRNALPLRRSTSVYQYRWRYEILQDKELASIWKYLYRMTSSLHLDYPLLSFSYAIDSAYLKLCVIL